MVVGSNPAVPTIPLLRQSRCRSSRPVLSSGGEDDDPDDAEGEIQDASQHPGYDALFQGTVELLSEAALEGPEANEEDDKRIEFLGFEFQQAVSLNRVDVVEPHEQSEQ